MDLLIAFALGELAAAVLALFVGVVAAPSPTPAQSLTASMADIQTR
jgi:hypothetical protein